MSRTTPAIAPEQRAASRWLDVAIIVIAMLAIAGLWAETIYQARNGRDRAIAGVVKANANLVRTFEEQTVRTLQGADQFLLLARREYAQQGERFDFAAIFESAMLDKDLVLNGLVADEYGDVVQRSDRQSASINLRDREHFVVHQVRDTGQPFISQPLQARVAEQRAIVVTRRINKADGTFGGIVSVALNPFYFTKLYEQVDLGKGGVIELLGLDGVMRARYADGDRSIGQNISGSDMLQRIASSPADSFTAHAQIDGVTRIFTYRKLAQYPLVVTAGVVEDVALADAMNDARVSRWISAFTTLLVLMGAGLLLWLTHRQRGFSGALQVSEQRLRALLDGLPARIWFRDAQGRYVAVNSSEQQHLGLPEDQIIGKTVHQILPRELADRYAATDALVNETSGPINFELRIDADQSWREIVKAPLLSADGKLAGLVGISSDITQRKRTEIEVVKIKAALEHAVEGISRLSANGRFESVNAAYAACAGFDVADLIGQSWRMTVHPDDVPLAEAMCQRMAETGKSEAELRGIRKDGSVYYKSVVVVRVSAEDHDQGAHYCFVKDITERMHTNIALRQSEQRLRALLDDIPDRVWLKDTQGRFVAINRAFETALKKSESELIGKTLAEATDEPCVQDMMREDLQVIETRAAIRFESRHRFGADWQDVIKAPIIDAKGEVAGIVGISRNITAMKQMFAELEAAKFAAESANRAKSEFLAAMSHDIRTPMTGVLGMAEMLAETALTAEQREHLDTMRASGESMLEIIDSILNFAKIEAGKLEPRPVAFDPAALVRQTAELFRARTEANGVAIRCRIDAPARCRLIGDPALLGRTLTNLVGNAVKFTEQGEICAGLTVTLDTDGHAVAQFEISDTGIGISSEDQQRLFQPFSQADRSSTRRFAGTGLGLALSKSMIDLLGGNLQMQSTLGKGSRFHFALRLPQAPEATVLPDLAAGAVADAVRALPQLQGRVLLAEDHPVNRKVLERMLAKYQLEVLHAADGVEALARWREGGIDLILMDCHMPALDGYSATEAIRAEEAVASRDGVRSRVPIIALTANAMAGDARACLDAGMDGYTSKPVRAGRMTRLLKRYLGGAGAVVPVCRPRVDANTVKILLGSGTLHAAVDRLAQNGAVQLETLRTELQAGLVDAAVLTAGELHTVSTEAGAPLLALLFGEIQSAAAAGAFEDARAALPELEAMLHATLDELQVVVRRAA